MNLKRTRLVPPRCNCIYEGRSALADTGVIVIVIASNCGLGLVSSRTRNTPVGERIISVVRFLVCLFVILNVETLSQKAGRSCSNQIALKSVGPARPPGTCLVCNIPMRKPS